MPTNEERRACANTDKEIWRKIPDDYYSPSIHVTKDGAVGINVGGRVIVASVEKWFDSLLAALEPKPKFPSVSMGDIQDILQIGHIMFSDESHMKMSREQVIDILRKKGVEVSDGD